MTGVPSGPAENQLTGRTRERGLDFRDAWRLFDGRALYTYPSPRAAEARLVSVGLLEQRCIAVVWLERDGARRIISMRRVRDGEEKTYRALFG
jgi:uncharacterized DUF497 family protein